MVAHSIHKHLGRYLLAGHNPQGHAVLLIVTHGVVLVLIHIVGNHAEEAPYTCLAATHSAKVERCVCIGKAKVLILATEPSELTCYLCYIGSVDAILGVVPWECCYACLIGMCRHITIGNTTCHPYDTLILGALAYELHNPSLLGVDKRE